MIEPLSGAVSDYLISLTHYLSMPMHLHLIVILIKLLLERKA